MADQDIPVDDVMRMIQKGMSDMDIITRLSEEGYSPIQISDALNQAKIKKEISGAEGLQPSIMQQVPVPTPKQAPVPSPKIIPSLQPAQQAMPAAQEYPAYPYQYPTYQPPEQQPKLETEAIEEIAEEIVNEKWSEIKSKIADVIEWKTYAEKRITSVDDRIKRMEASMDRLQAALLSKMQEYQRSVKDIGAEMAGLEGAFGKILSPFVENMKELSRITGELKAAKPKAKAKAKSKTITTTTTVVAKPKTSQPQPKVVKEVTKVTVKK